MISNPLLQTESDLYLLVTFHNLSAPFTVDCEGAYIEVERENNGFEARWCGNRVTQVITWFLSADDHTVIQKLI